MRAELCRREREAADKERQLERYAADLRETFKQERARAQELRRSYTATVSGAVERRRGPRRVHRQARRAGRRLRPRDRPRARAAADRAPELEFGFLLHDIGKVAIPDAILYKPGALTDEERALMAQHPVIGAADRRAGSSSSTEAVEVVRSHHERWDGPATRTGSAGEEIPLAARVFAVADVLDALTTDRPYRPASPLARGAGDDHAGVGHPVRPARRRGVQLDRRRDVRADRRRRSGSVMSGVLIVDDDQFIRKLIATTLEDVAGSTCTRPPTGSRRSRSRAASGRRWCSSTSTCLG